MSYHDANHPQEPPSQQSIHETYDHQEIDGHDVEHDRHPRLDDHPTEHTTHGSHPQGHDLDQPHDDTAVH